MLTKLARHLGAEAVAATASASKAEYLAAQGAQPFDYRAADLEQRLRAFAPKGFDAIFDASGHRNFNLDHRLLATGGRLVTYGTGLVARRIPVRTPLGFARFGASFGLMMAKIGWWNLRAGERRAQFFGIVDSKKLEPVRWRDDLTTLCELVRDGRLAPVVAGSLALDQVSDGHRRLDDGRITGQLTVDPWFDPSAERPVLAKSEIGR